MITSGESKMLRYCTWMLRISTTGQKPDWINHSTNPINRIPVICWPLFHINSSSIIQLSHQPFTYFHIHLFISRLSSFHPASLYVFHLPRLALLASQSRGSNHYSHINKQITLQMVIDMHINQLCLLIEKVFKLTCQDILHLKYILCPWRSQ